MQGWCDRVQDHRILHPRYQGWQRGVCVGLARIVPGKVDGDRSQATPLLNLTSAPELASPTSRFLLAKFHDTVRSTDTLSHRRSCRRLKLADGQGWPFLTFVLLVRVFSVKLTL